MKRKESCVLLLCLTCSLGLLTLLPSKPLRSEESLENEHFGVREDDMTGKWYNWINTSQKANLLVIPYGRTLHQDDDSILFQDNTDKDIYRAESSDYSTWTKVLDITAAEGIFIPDGKTAGTIYACTRRAGGDGVSYFSKSVDSGENWLDYMSIAKECLDVFNIAGTIYVLTASANELQVYELTTDDTTPNTVWTQRDTEVIAQVEGDFGNNFFPTIAGFVSGTDYYFVFEDNDVATFFEFASATNTIKQVSTIVGYHIIEAPLTSLFGPIIVSSATTFSESLSTGVAYIMLGDAIANPNEMMFQTIDGGNTWTATTMANLNVAIADAYVKATGRKYMWNAVNYYIYEFNDQDTTFNKVSRQTFHTDHYRCITDGGVLFRNDDTDTHTDIYEFQNNISNLTVCKVQKGAYKIDTARIETEYLFPDDYVVEIFDKNGLPDFKGRLLPYKMNEGVRMYPCESYNTVVTTYYIDTTYSAKTLDFIAKAIIDLDPSNHLYYDATSIPAIAGNHTVVYNEEEAWKALMFIAKVGSCVLYIEPDGKVWFKAVPVDSTIVVTQATNDITPPQVIKETREYNYVKVHGGFNIATGKLFVSDGHASARDDASILLNGKLTWTEPPFPAAMSQTAIDNVAIGIFATNGVKNHPLALSFLLSGQGRLQPLETMNVQHTSFTETAVADDYYETKITTDYLEDISVVQVSSSMVIKVGINEVVAHSAENQTSEEINTALINLKNLLGGFR